MKTDPRTSNTTRVFCICCQQSMLTSLVNILDVEEVEDDVYQRFVAVGKDVVAIATFRCLCGNVSQSVVVDS